MTMGLVENFMCFAQWKNCENRLKFEKVTESLKVGAFLRHSVESIVENETGELYV